MAVFRSPERQAAQVMQRMQGTIIRSVGTVRAYEQCLTRAAEWLKSSGDRDGLRGMTPEKAVAFLEARGEFVGQKTLDQERQAIQAMMQHVTGRLEAGERLPVVRAELQQALDGRAYTPAQVALISAAQDPRNSLATQIAHAAGLRAHELLTLQRRDERDPDPRASRDEKWAGRAGDLYTVQGKGGLVREVLLPHALAERLEAVRLDAPLAITDRGVHYQSHYDIGGGQRWSNSVSAAANRVLGWSTGAHGLRHSYAQERMNELAMSGLSRADALEVVSQELGHFRPEITEVYLR